MSELRQDSRVSGQRQDSRVSGRPSRPALGERQKTEGSLAVRNPLDDTHKIIDEFGVKREVPMVLQVSQVEMIRDHLHKHEQALSRAQRMIDFELANPTFFARARKAQQQAIKDYEDEKRRVEVMVSTLKEKHSKRRDAVLAKITTELASANELYVRSYEDLLKGNGEPEALKRLAVLCEPYLAEMQDHPYQPADLGQPKNVRTLVELIERADEATRGGGAFDRLTAAAVAQAGSGCMVTMAPVKGFRRCLEKAEEDYGGDFLMISDPARCSVVAPKISDAADLLAWLTKPAMRSGEDLPTFQPLLIKDRLSPSFDAEEVSMYRYLLLVGKLQCDGNSFINVEIQLHCKRLYELKRRLHELHEWRKSLGADDEVPQQSEGELGVGKQACVREQQPGSSNAGGSYFVRECVSHPSSPASSSAGSHPTPRPPHPRQDRIRFQGHCAPPAVL